MAQIDPDSYCDSLVKNASNPFSVSATKYIIALTDNDQVTLCQKLKATLIPVRHWT